MSLAESPPEKQNFRTCGRGTGGVEMSPKRKKQDRVHRPLSREGTPVSSIPSRQTTVINAGAGTREAHGFGSQAMRFHEKNISLDAEGDAPGPGTYGQQLAFHEESGAKTSLGVKGTGSFASKSRRFRPVSLPNPGPCNYDQDVRPAKPQALEAVQSPSFAQPTSFNPHKSNVRPSPGPGSYNAKHSVNSARATEGVRACSSVFHGNDDREPFGCVLPEASLPGPGLYDARSCSTPPGAAARFKGPISRPVMSVKPGLPTASVSTADHAGEYVRKVGVIPTDVPGPGQYDIDRPIESRKHFNALGTGSFQKGFSNEPRKWLHNAPGPADYDRPVDPSQGAAKAAFTSGSERICGSGIRAPGPAFYSPKQPNAQSFHLNIRRKWL